MRNEKRIINTAELAAMPVAERSAALCGDNRIIGSLKVWKDANLASYNEAAAHKRISSPRDLLRNQRAKLDGERTYGDVELGSRGRWPEKLALETLNGTAGINLAEFRKEHPVEYAQLVLADKSYRGEPVEDAIQKVIAAKPKPVQLKPTYTLADGDADKLGFPHGIALDEQSFNSAIATIVQLELEAKQKQIHDEAKAVIAAEEQAAAKQ